MDGFEEGIQTGIISHEFQPHVAKSIFRVASDVLRSINVRSRRVVLAPTWNLYGYHLVLPTLEFALGTVTRLLLFPVYSILAIWYGMSSTPHDGVVSVASQRGGLDCSLCDRPPWRTGICSGCGTIYSTVHDHVSVLTDRAILRQLVP